MSPPRSGDASESEALDVDSAAENPDEAWEGLDPSEAVSIEAGGAAVTEITLVDVDTGGLLDRPVGSDGASKPDVGTGDVQLTLTWALDRRPGPGRHRTRRDGDLVLQDTGPTSTGGELDVDSNVGCATTAASRTSSGRRVTPRRARTR